MDNLGGHIYIVVMPRQLQSDNLVARFFELFSYSKFTISNGNTRTLPLMKVFAINYVNLLQLYSSKSWSVHSRSSSVLPHELLDTVLDQRWWTQV